MSVEQYFVTGCIAVVVALLAVLVMYMLALPFVVRYTDSHPSLEDESRRREYRTIHGMLHDLGVSLWILTALCIALTAIGYVIEVLI